MVNDTMFVHHFLDLNLAAGIFFEKEGTKEKGCVDLEIVDLGTYAHLMGFEENFMQSFFIVFFLVT